MEFSQNWGYGTVRIVVVVTCYHLKVILVVMAILTIPQIMQVCRSAGFSGNGLNTMTAIILCESGGNTNATNTTGNTPPSRDRGLCQINSFWHPEVSDSCAYDSVCSTKEAYRISSNGTNFTLWSTYPACSNSKMSIVQSSSGGITSIPQSGGMINIAAPSTIRGQKAWYTFPRIDNLGGVEPFGGFPKPDSNIQIPTGYPVTALLPGTVSGIDKASAWGCSVTIRLDKAMNSLATHNAYLHLRGDIQVTVGQHVTSGQLIAYNGLAQACGAQKVPLGFALYNGDNYGSGSAWQYMTRANLNGGLLDPVPLLNSAANGSLKIPSGSSSIGSSSGGIAGFLPGSAQFMSISQKSHDILNTVPGFVGIVDALDLIEQFQPLSLQSNTPTDTTNTDYTLFGIDTTVPNPVAVYNKAVSAITLPANNIQAILVFITANTAAAVIRGILMLIGIVIIMSLIANLFKKYGPSPEDMAAVAGALA